MPTLVVALERLPAIHVGTDPAGPSRLGSHPAEARDAGQHRALPGQWSGRTMTTSPVLANRREFPPLAGN